MPSTVFLHGLMPLQVTHHGRILAGAEGVDDGGVHHTARETTAPLACRWALIRTIRVAGRSCVSRGDENSGEWFHPPAWPTPWGADLPAPGTGIAPHTATYMRARMRTRRDAIIYLLDTY